ncbi:MAG TPA: SET domain-containing protein-lysine N-methyltransferase [Chitinophagales bacterium]|nr:SET domain-containing protein-lysine N-methyltransferase [Chitinophagales bacterium]HNL83695.1 SET domain-containing protein-lysine N-methyltransferase [Chitinophagales bacterium]
MELYIKNVKDKGRGVFCTVDLNEGDIIEVCPVIVCPKKDCKHLDKTHLYHYYFMWGNDGKSAGVVCGFGAMYNHAYNPNAIYETFYEDEIFRVKARRHIPANTEITINYNFYPDSQTPVWFDTEGLEKQAKEKAEKKKLKKADKKEKKKAKKEKKK